MHPINPQLIGRPNFPPRRDLVDWEDGKQVVKLGVDLENYTGDVFLKPKHIIQIARVIGMVPKTEVEDKEAVIEQLRLKIIELETKTGDELINGKLDDIIGYVSGIAVKCECPSIILPVGKEEEPETSDAKSEIEGKSEVSGDSGNKESKLESTKPAKPTIKSLFDGL